jgi:hypothetical protein
MVPRPKYSDRRSEPSSSPGAGTLQPEFNIISLINTKEFRCGIGINQIENAAS